MLRCYDPERDSMGVVTFGSRKFRLRRPKAEAQSKIAGAREGSCLRCRGRSPRELIFYDYENSPSILA